MKHVVGIGIFSLVLSNVHVSKDLEPGATSAAPLSISCDGEVSMPAPSDKITVCGKDFSFVTAELAKGIFGRKLGCQDCSKRSPCEGALDVGSAGWELTFQKRLICASYPLNEPADDAEVSFACDACED